MVNTAAASTGAIARRFAAWRYFGFTIVELLVTLGIIGVVALIALVGLNPGGTQLLDNTAAEFVTNLRTAQNQVTSGVADVVTVSIASGATSYTLTNQTTGVVTTVNLPAGITMSATGFSSAAICFVNRNLKCYGGTDDCTAAIGNSSRNCDACGWGSAGSGFICSSGTISSLSRAEVVFTQGTVTKKVWVEGLGMYVARIYGQ